MDTSVRHPIREAVEATRASRHRAVGAAAWENSLLSQGLVAPRLTAEAVVEAAARRSNSAGLGSRTAGSSCFSSPTEPSAGRSGGAREPWVQFEQTWDEEATTMSRFSFWPRFARTSEGTETEFYTIDPARIAWIREHEPQNLRRLPAATPRNVRRLLRLGLFAMTVSLWLVVSGIWIPRTAPRPELHWFLAGCLLGAGWLTFVASRLLGYLAYLGGDNGERPRSESGSPSESIAVTASDRL